MLNKNVSIEALERLIKLKLPLFLTSMEYQVIKPVTKKLTIAGLQIKVAPEVVIRGVVDGNKVIGALKIHICKSIPVDYQKSVLATTVVYKYLREQVAGPDEMILPDLCFYLDVFSDRLVPAPADAKKLYPILNETGTEILRFWKAA